MSYLPAVLAPALLLLSANGTAQDPAADLASYIEQIIPSWQVPGLAIGVVSGGEVVLARGFGKTRLGADEAVDEHTLFAISSTTKAMTAALLGTLVDEKKLGWDDPVSRHVTGFQLSDPYATREVTVRDLLTHRAGLGNADGLWYGSDRTRAEILAQVPLIPATYSLRDGFVYQNIMYALAGELSASVAGQSWEELLTARIFQPLGMRRSVPVTSLAGQASNVANPHAEVDGVVIPIENELLDSVAPAGAVWSSVGEMSRWMRMLLNDGKWQGTQILSAESVAEMFTPQTLIDKDAIYPYLDMLAPHWVSYGLGWFQLDYEGRAVQFHTGSIDGMSAIVGLVPDEGLGVVVLANLDHAELRHALLWKTIDLFGGRPDGRDWSAELLSFYSERSAVRKAARTKREAGRVSSTNPSLALAEYAGSYENGLYGRLAITLKDGTLSMATGPRSSGTLEHWHHDTFLWRYDRRWQGESLISFHLSAAGASTQVLVDGEQYDRVVE